MTGVDLAKAAEALVGTRFRLHGRDPATGLDCIGLLAAAMAALGRAIAVPTGYSLRLSGLTQWLPDPATMGFTVTDTPSRPGDVVMLRLGAGQFHLAIAGNQCWVHAHAGLRRVVRQPDLPSGELLHHWRLVPPI